MIRLLTVFVVLGLVACREDEPPPHAKTASSAAAATGPSSSARVGPGPGTRECLARELPKSFQREDYPKVDAALSRCQPADDREKVYGFRFGRDASTGLELEVYGSSIAYVDVTSNKECLCLRGEPIFSAGERPSYAACAPPRAIREPRLSKDASYTLARDQFQMDDHLLVQSKMGPMREIMPYLAEVLRIDGRPVKDPADIERAFAEFPARPPAVLRLRLDQLGIEALDLHYVSRAVYEELWSAIEEIRREHRDPPACGPNVFLDGALICARSVPSNPATARWAAFLPKLEKLARSAKPVVEAPWEHTKEACRAIARLPPVIGFQRDQKSRVEFRYVQWLF